MVKRRPSFYHVIMLKRTSVAHAILAALTDLAEDLTISRRRIYAKTSISYRRFTDHRVWTERKRVKTEFKNLVSAGYLQVRKSGPSAQMIVLTDKGLRYSLLHCVALRKSPLPDTLRCYVSFDIPERERHVRNDLRMILQRLGFKKEHQSLWSSRDDHTLFFIELIRRQHAQAWVKVFLGDPLTW